MNKKIIIGVITLAVILLIAGYWFLIGSSPVGEVALDDTKATAERKLLVVTDNSFPPFEFEEDGEVKGIDVDVFGLAMQRLGISYEIQLLPWTRALKLVETGKADVLLTAAYNEKRGEFAYFTPNQIKFLETNELPKAYISKADRVFFMRNLHRSSLKFESLEQIREDKYRVGLNANYVYGPKILGAGWNITTYQSTEESFTALSKGEIDMYLADDIVGLWVLGKLGLQDQIGYIKNPVITLVYNSPFSKNSDYPNLKKIWEQTNQELEKIHESGEYDEIYDSYIQ